MSMVLDLQRLPVETESDPLYPEMGCGPTCGPTSCGPTCGPTCGESSDGVICDVSGISATVCLVFVTSASV